MVAEPVECVERGPRETLSGIELEGNVEPEDRCLIKEVMSARVGAHKDRRTKAGHPENHSAVKCVVRSSGILDDDSERHLDIIFVKESIGANTELDCWDSAAGILGVFERRCEFGDGVEVVEVPDVAPKNGWGRECRSEPAPSMDLGVSRRIVPPFLISPGPRINVIEPQTPEVRRLDRVKLVSDRFSRVGVLPEQRVEELGGADLHRH